MSQCELPFVINNLYVKITFNSINRQETLRETILRLDSSNFFN